jgi:hypothetical protein
MAPLEHFGDGDQQKHATVAPRAGSFTEWKLHHATTAPLAEVTTISACTSDWATTAPICAKVLLQRAATATHASNRKGLTS